MWLKGNTEDQEAPRCSWEIQPWMVAQPQRQLKLSAWRRRGAAHISTNTQSQSNQCSHRAVLCRAIPCYTGLRIARVFGSNAPSFLPSFLPRLLTLHYLPCYNLLSCSFFYLHPPQTHTHSSSSSSPFISPHSLLPSKGFNWWDELSCSHFPLFPSQVSSEM